MKSKFQQVAYSACVLLSITACTEGQKGPKIQEGSNVVDAITVDKIEIVNLEQGWTTDTQQQFYFTDQGSRVMPYDWFLFLEQVTSQTLFRDAENINRYRYLPAEANDWNPDGLPVGFVKNVDKKNDVDWMGLTCAACHTGQISYKNVEMRLEGGPTLADFETFNEDLVAALSSTYQDQAKFDRFALNVLGAGATPNQVNDLRQDLLQQTEVLATRNLVNRPDNAQERYGFSRLDAIGAIFNQILADFNGLPSEGRPADAPVSYPFLWGTHQSDVVQWPGFAPNGPASIGALIRNGGEVLGVYGQIDIPEDTSQKHYPSSLDITNLGELEKWVAELRSPQWPAQYFPPIDPIAAANGKQHFEELCVSCHQVMPREDEGQMYTAVLTPLDEVGTDPTELLNMVQKRPAGKFAGRKEFVLAGPVIGEMTSGLEPLVNSVVGALLEHPFETARAALVEYEGGLIASQANDGVSSTPLEGPEELFEALEDFGDAYHENKEALATMSNNVNDPNAALVYKARPLNGVWATAPYLHNGSVANLYELLLPAEQRASEFYLGAREYDPINVGYDSEVSRNYAHAFKFDTTKKGNSNAGHEYGVDLTEQQRREVVEYMKTL